MDNKKKDKKNKWYEELIFKYKAGISNYFIITGNIYDIVSPGKNLTTYLLYKLKREEEFPRVGMFCPGGEMFEYFPDWRSTGGHKASDIAFCLFDKQKTAVIIEHAEYFFPDCQINDIRHTEQSIALKEAVRNERFSTGENLLILITDNIHNLHPQVIDVGAKPTIIEIPYPSEMDRLDYIEFLDATSNKKIKKEITNEELARATVGLSYKSIEDIYLQSEAIGVLKRDFVIERKNEWIKSEFGEVLDILDVEGYNFNFFAGQEHLKKYHREVIIEQIKKGKLEIIPKGLLYTGPPGTGKTYFAKCFAGEANINFVEFKLSKIMDKYVGESERNLAKALNCLQSIAPVGVFVDEIDQVFTKVSDSNGIRQSMFQMILSFLSDPKHRGKIIWIGATNYPNNLDEALKRTGRFDKKMPFLPPELNDRIETFKIHINKFSIKNNLTEEDYLELGNKTEGYTQAEIEGIVMKAMELAIRNQYDSLNKDTFLQALKYTIKASNEKINEMINLAISECNDLEFLPEKYWNNPNLGGM